MEHEHLKDYYTKGFQDGRVFGILIMVVIAMAIGLVALSFYYINMQ